MKKLAFVFLLFLTVTATFGQNKWQQNQINHFVDAAVKEYSLNEDQKKELSEIRTTVVMAYHNSNQQVKDGAITEDEKKEITKTASNVFNKAFIQMTGKSYKELEPFFQRMQKELKNAK